MFLWFLISATFFLTVSKAAQYSNVSEMTLEDRIIGGVDSPISDFPHQVGISYNGVPFCGGSIIGKQYILTAAHCTHGMTASDLEVRVGSSRSDSGGKIYKVDEIIDHPGFLINVYHNDISILKLEAPLELSAEARIIKIKKEEDLIPGTMAYISGWGVDHEKKQDSVAELKSTKIPLLPFKDCKKYLKEKISNSMICAGYKDGQIDACRGDSGGPLVQDNVLIGVVSWGIGCARPGLPGVYTNVARYKDFIYKHTGI